MTHEDIHVLIPGTWAYVTAYGRRGFADVIKSRILRDFPWWYGG